MKSPFKFLDSYTKDDRDIFFGREREIGELYHRVFESKIMLVYGVSGTGKSSLIHCGLANKFQETDWLPLVIRRGGNIVESMAASIRGASLTSQQNNLNSPSDFRKGVRSLYLDHYKPVFFIFDQFEELFIFGDKEERKSFVQIVKSLFESDLQCRLIFVMREEYMAGVTEFEKYIPAFFANRVRIEKMSHANALEAIKGPCNFANISLEEGFAEALLEKLSPDEADVELTYLQVFLDRLFRLAQTEKHSGTEGISFNLNLFQKTGDVSDLLGSFLEEQIALLQNPDEGLAVLKSFVSVKGSRKQMNLEEVSEYARTLGQPVEEAELKDLIRIFINLRILRDKDQNEKYELRHDALATKIYEKITLVEKEILEIFQFIDNAYNSYKKRGVCLSSDDLNYIAPYESRLFLSKELSGLINESRERLTRVKRRRRNIMLASAIALFAVFAVFTVWALKEKNKADKAIIKQDESILKLNENFEKVKRNQAQRIAEIYQQFELRNAENPFKIRPLWDKALNIQKASNDLSDFIYRLEYEMISEAENISIDSAKNVDLAMVRNKSNVDIPNKVLFNKDKNLDTSNILLLKQKILNFRQVIHNQIDRKDWDKINFSIEPEKAVKDARGDSASWENAYFKGTILAGAVTNLNNLITEINYIEIDAVTYIYSRITRESYSFNIITPVILTSNSVVKYGGFYQATLKLAAYDSRSNVEGYLFEGKADYSEIVQEDVSGKAPLISKDGEIDIKIPAKSLGPNTFGGFISITNMDGTILKLPFAFSFYVVKPLFIISLVNMNTLYYDIENPLNISVPGVASDKLKVRSTNGNPVLKNGYYYVKPITLSDCEIQVSYLDDSDYENRFPPVKFKVKDKPLPIASIKGITDDKIKKAEPLGSKELIASYPSDFDFGITFKVIGFTVAIIRDGKMITSVSNNNLFTDEQRQLFTTMRRGDKLYIQDIRVNGSDGSALSLKGLIYTID